MQTEELFVKDYAKVVEEGRKRFSIELKLVFKHDFMNRGAPDSYIFCSRSVSFSSFQAINLR